jgi:two-component system nitrogen regulation response regulator GlnG
VDTAEPGLERDLGYIGLSISCHPDLERIGERARLFDPGKAGLVRVSRSEPLFRDLHGRRQRPLTTLRASRSPIELALHSDGSVELAPSAAFELSIDGVRVEQRERFGVEQVNDGMLLQLGKHVLLRLGRFDVVAAISDGPAQLVGASAALRELRAELARAHALRLPVVLWGEPGTGKMLAAAALQRLCPLTYVRVNVAELSPPMARERVAAARGGGMILQHVDAASPELQAALLAALEGETVEARLISTSRHDLRLLARSGRFERALAQRLGFAIRVPPLREREDDVALLMAHFAREQLNELGEQARLAAPEYDRKPLLDAGLVAQLVRYEWPGNVRQLRNVARQLALHQQAGTQQVLRQLWPESQPPAAADSGVRRAPHALSEQDIAEALARCAYHIDRTARELGVSRSWLHARIETLPAVRKAKDLSHAEIGAALDGADGELAAAALALKVSTKGLQLQMKRLGLSVVRRR